MDLSIGRKSVSIDALNAPIEALSVPIDRLMWAPATGETFLSSSSPTRMPSPELKDEEKQAVARCRRYAARGVVDQWIWLGPAIGVFVMGLYMDSQALLVAGFGLLDFVLIVGLRSPARLWRPLASAITKLEDACEAPGTEISRSGPS